MRTRQASAPSERVGIGWRREVLDRRFSECGLMLHLEKTKLVYCKDTNRKRDYGVIQFDFLGYTFRPRLAKWKGGLFGVSYLPAAGPKALKAIRQTIRGWTLQTHCLQRDRPASARWPNQPIRKSGKISAATARYHGNSSRPIMASYSARRAASSSFRRQTPVSRKLSISSFSASGRSSSNACLFCSRWRRSQQCRADRGSR